MHFDAAQDHGVSRAVLRLPAQAPFEVADLRDVDAGAQPVITGLLCLGVVFGSFVCGLRFDLGRCSGLIGPKPRTRRCANYGTGRSRCPRQKASARYFTQSVSTLGLRRILRLRQVILWLAKPQQRHRCLQNQG